MRVLITAGGTFEPIDDVRGITNRSTGRLGAALANAFINAGTRVDLIASEALAARADWLDERVHITPFLSYRDLEGALQVACENPPDLLLMAAAVADYSPVAFEGKLPSTAASQTLTLQRNPKLLSTLAQRCQGKTKIVGFKLTSNASIAQRIATAERQIEANTLFACVANDMGDMAHNQHPVTLVSASGQTLRIEGTKVETAEQIVTHLLHMATSSPVPF